MAGKISRVALSSNIIISVMDIVIVGIDPSEHTVMDNAERLMQGQTQITKPLIPPLHKKGAEAALCVFFLIPKKE